MIDDVLDPGGSAVVALGLSNQDDSDTFPGRTLTADQAEELAGSLVRAAARARAGLAAPSVGGEQDYGEVPKAIRAPVPLTSTGSVPGEGQDEQADAIASPPATSEQLAVGVSGLIGLRLE